MLKKIIFGLLALFLIAQLFRPKKHAEQPSKVVYAATTQNLGVGQELGTILETACYDCHSNATKYPWYAQITPVNYWLQNHIKEGKEHLNFSELNTYSTKKRNHKLEEIVEEVEEHKMPLKSYTWVHRNAKLTEAQRNLIVNWAKEEMDLLY